MEGLISFLRDYESGLSYGKRITLDTRHDFQKFIKRVEKLTLEENFICVDALDRDADLFFHNFPYLSLSVFVIRHKYNIPQLFY